MFIYTREQIVHLMKLSVNKKPPVRIRRQIDIELARRGWKQDRLAIEINRARNTVNRAINHGENQATLHLILSTLGIR
jgi:ribosome-binding protein aMBF1 (putative translation factor)